MGPWVQDALRLMDADGAWMHYKYKGELGDQPALDMEVLDVIKSRWCELRNKETEKKWQKR